MDKLLPLLSNSLRDILKNAADKTNDPIVLEILKADECIENINSFYWAVSSETLMESIISGLNELITDEGRMFSVRNDTECEISYLPKGRVPEYTSNGNWAKQNRQTGKPGRLFQKLLKREFKTKEWEDFSNILKSEMCSCLSFTLVEGEDIRHWYNEDNYFAVKGTLGNSCMRYEEAERYFDIYVENAKMLITTKDNLLTGRAIVWNIDGVTIMDRIYTCFDYLTNCFIDYAKAQGWYIRDHNGLLSTDDTQYWLGPEDNYTSPISKKFVLHIKRPYDYFPYMDSFRYYDGSTTLYCFPAGPYALDSTDGSISEISSICCESCGRTFVSFNEDEVPEGMHYSEYADAYFCDDCCYYCESVSDYIPNDALMYEVNLWGSVKQFPAQYVIDDFISQPDGHERTGDFVMIDGEYHQVDTHIKWDPDNRQYKIV